MRLQSLGGTAHLDKIAGNRQLSSTKGIFITINKLFNTFLWSNFLLTFHSVSVGLKSLANAKNLPSQSGYKNQIFAQGSASNRLFFESVAC